MSPAEIKGRVGDGWTKRQWRSRQIRPGQEDPLPLPASVAPFPTPLRDFDPDTLSEEGRARLLRAADAALRRKIPTPSISTTEMWSRSARSNMSGNRRGIIS
jgi:hypothetical protein